MAYPNLRQAIWLVALLAVWETSMGLLIFGIGLVIGHPLEENNYLMGVSRFAVLFLMLSYISHRKGRRWRSLLQYKRKTTDCRVWTCVSISIIGAAMAILELDKALVSLYPIPGWLQSSIQSTIGHETTYLSALFGAVFVAPVVEEFLFRGIILGGLIVCGHRRHAIVWTSILCGVYHLNPWQFPSVFIGGLLLAWWVIRTGSLLPALFGHALNNFIFTTIMHFEMPYMAGSEDMNIVVFNPWWWTAAGVALAALGLWWFHLISNGRQPASPGAVKNADSGNDGV